MDHGSSGVVQFETLLEHYRGAMLRRARSILKNRADAEDAVQEAMESAWRARGRFVRGSNPLPWLLKITTNAAIDSARRRNREPLTGAAIPTYADAPEQRALRSETARSIEAAVAQLKSAHRRAFVLHDVHGYSSREISSGQHLAYHTVRTHLFRARRELREALSGVRS